jgi:hypothetical protein
MTLEQQHRAIESFGYTEAEARFLRLVALHGGYFVRRQFLLSAQCDPGKRAQDFLERLLARKHACREIFREDRHLFRLHFKPIYAAIGDDDNRNRREHQPATIRLRLMGLDFVLEHPEHEYLATGADKLSYFVEARGIDAGLLPARAFCVRGVLIRRQFVDGFPLFLRRDATPKICFCYVDDGQLSTAAFRSYLRQYQRLFEALGTVKLYFLTQESRRFDAAQRVLRRFRNRVADPTGMAIDLTRLLDHFPHRLLWERRQTGTLSRAHMDRLAEDLHTFNQDRHERLFELWRERGDEAVRGELATETVRQTALDVDLTACILVHDYDLFGDLRAAS